MNQIWPEIKRDFARCWKRLFLANLFFKLLAVVLLTPLVAGLMRFLVTFSGQAVLADQEIAFFFLSPVGWLCLIVLGAVWIAIGAVELATLISIVAVPESRNVRPLEALRFAASKSWRIVQVTARMVGIALLILAPFLIAAAIAYSTLLSAHDINFYLTEKPPEFIVAIVVAVLIVLVLIFVFLRLYASWFYAIPLVLLENVAPADALRLSRTRATGHRRRIVIWLAGWLLVTTIVSSLAAGLVIGVGHLLLPAFAGTLSMLVFVSGISLLVWSLINLAVTLFTDTTFALLSFSFYRQLGASDEFSPDRLPIGTDGTGEPLLRITRKRVIVAGVIGVALAVAAGTLILGSIRFEDQIEIMAHRGSSASAPENTMAAVRQAIVDEADWVEIDVQETADGEVVVFHDSDFMKLSRNPLKIWDATMDDLQHIDIGSWFDAKFSDERVPTLRQVLQECKGQIGVNIELKYYGHDEQLEQRVVEIVEECGMQDQIVVMSLKMDAVRKMKALRPEWRVGFLMSVAAGNLKNIEADFLAINASFVDFSFVQSAHSIGKQVFVWTVNDAVGMSSMISKGVDALITDEPALARQVLAQRAQMTVAQRLLIELAQVFGVAPDFGEQ